MSIVAPAKSNRPSKTSRIASWEWWALLYLRLALGVSFLSGIADRFGLYKGRNVGYGNFAGFVQYTAKVNSFMPASMIPLVIGLWLRWAALGSCLLLILFGSAMAISFGIKSPLDYSVFSASAGALVLALYEFRKTEPTFGTPDRC